LWPINHRDFETPEQIFLDLWNGGTVQVRDLLKTACQELLAEFPRSWTGLLYLAEVIVERAT
jgi:hypothetical protein